MTLTPPVRTAVLEVVRRLRDPAHGIEPDTVGYFLVIQLPPEQNPLYDVREALGLRREDRGSLARWARGKSRKEVAQALERVATSEASAR